ncbi:hypothetical protein T484DRAFT_1788915 [Baffinella frigidus]|nr:hypothetical protein T484DRAFT_1788915 [Cryptophyta sp. CCMP2293]
MQNAFRSGIDIHLQTASQVFGVPVEEVTPTLRSRAKAINFGIIYGQSATGLAKSLSIPVEEAKAFIEAYFTQYPGIGEYMSDTKAFAQKHGFVETLFGRRCHIKNINAGGQLAAYAYRQNINAGDQLAAYAYRQAINAPIQGTAADIIKRAMLRMEDELDTKGIRADMLLQVHDELIFEVHPEDVERAKEVVRNVMEHACEPEVMLSVPLSVDVGTALNWEEAH